MKIERTCRIELSADEVLAAITDYLHEKHRYSYGRDALKQTEDALSFASIAQNGDVSVNWGEAPEPEEAATEMAAEAAPATIEIPANPEAVNV